MMCAKIWYAASFYNNKCETPIILTSRVLLKQTTPFSLSITDRIVIIRRTGWFHTKTQCWRPSSLAASVQPSSSCCGDQQGGNTRTQRCPARNISLFLSFLLERWPPWAQKAWPVRSCPLCLRLVWRRCPQMQRFQRRRTARPPALPSQTTSAPSTPTSRAPGPVSSSPPRTSWRRLQLRLRL